MSEMTRLCKSELIKANHSFSTKSSVEYVKHRHAHTHVKKVIQQLKYLKLFVNKKTVKLVDSITHTYKLIEIQYFDVCFYLTFW